jgi:membrane complex biogenesis BtpA family protein
MKSDRKALGALGELFGNPKPIIAMIHLPPLPGSPFHRGQPFEEVVEQALRDAEVLKGEEVDGLMVENFGDRPFLKPDEIGHETTAFLAVVAREVIKATGLPVGISCLANGAVQAIAASVASGAKWIRVNCWANAYIADEGVIEAAAPKALRYMRHLGVRELKVFADVHVKHGSHFIVSDRPFEELVRDVEFFGADAVVVSGARTGEETPVERVLAAKGVTELPVLIGSGLRPENAGKLLMAADGAIVGTYLRKDGDPMKPVDPERTRRLMEAVRELRRGLL